MHIEFRSKENKKNLTELWIIKNGKKNKFREKKKDY